MATKIINVEQSDNLDEIKHIIEATEANEFFFVVPKSQKVFSSIDSVQSIKELSKLKGKKITLITGDPKVAVIALENGLNVLEERRKPQRRLQVQKEQIREVVPQTEPSEILDVKDVKEKKVEVPIQIEPFQSHKDKTETELERFYSQTPQYSAPIKKENVYYPTKLKEILPSGKPLKKVYQSNWPKHFSKKTTYGISGIFILVLIFGILNAGQNANITITPQKETATISLRLTANEHPEGENQILGNLIEAEKTLSKQGQSSGEKEVEQKATGYLTVYNTFSSDSQTLVATTRFQTKEGLIFRLIKTSIIPGASIANGQLTPGAIEVEVTADRVGQEYNIGPARFSIPGFLGTTKYDKFFAESKTQMKNGFKGKAKLATKSDIEKVYSELTIQLKEELAKEAKLKLDGDTEINPNQVDVKIESTQNSAVENEIGETFTIELKGTLLFINLQKQEVLKTIETYLTKRNKTGKVISSTLQYEIKNQEFDQLKKSSKFDLEATVDIAESIDVEKIASEITGLDENRVREYFKKNQEIEKVKILISPFWRKSMPKNTSKINIEIVTP